MDGWKGGKDDDGRSEARQEEEGVLKKGEQNMNVADIMHGFMGELMHPSIWEEDWALLSSK